MWLFERVYHDSAICWWHPWTGLFNQSKTNIWISAFLASRGQQVSWTGIAVSWRTFWSLTRIRVGAYVCAFLLTTVLFIDKFKHPLTTWLEASDLNKYLHWAKTWQMDFIVLNCAVLLGTYRSTSIAWRANSCHGLKTRTNWVLPSTPNYHGSHTSTRWRTKSAKHLVYYFFKHFRRRDWKWTKYEISKRPTLE